VLDRIGLIQIDSVNGIARGQELVLCSRLGAHPGALIDDATAAGELFEYWLHEASHVPMELFPAVRWKMDNPHRWRGLREWAAEHGEFVEHVYERVLTEGPLVAGDLKQRVGKKEAWWDWDDGKAALEVLFNAGRVVGTRRPRDFARVYDVTERVIAPEVLAAPALSEHDGRKLLLERAARHYRVRSSR